MLTDRTPISEVTNEDCMIMMQRYPDKFFDLAVVDPPYGINIAKTGSNGNSKFVAKDWDKSIPLDSYFNELCRVSENQIVWGGNYFPFLWGNGCKGFVFWNKLNHHDNRADGELAWTSFNRLPLYFEYMWDGNRYGTKGKIKGVGEKTIRIHPTEKPVALYHWLLTNYAEKGDKILDTHLGSQSSRIAAYKLGFDFWGTELDESYFKEGCARFEKAISEPLFDSLKPKMLEQKPLF